MKGLALKPSFFSTERLKVKEPESEEVWEDMEDEEKHLYALSKHKGWEILSAHIDNEIRILEDLNKQAIATGMSFEQIGYNSVVLNGIKDLVDSVFGKVNDAIKAVENGTK